MLLLHELLLCHRYSAGGNSILDVCETNSPKNNSKKQRRRAQGAQHRRGNERRAQCTATHTPSLRATGCIVDHRHPSTHASGFVMHAPSPKLDPVMARTPNMWHARPPLPKRERNTPHHELNCNTQTMRPTTLPEACASCWPMHTPGQEAHERAAGALDLGKVGACTPHAACSANASCLLIPETRRKATRQIQQLLTQARTHATTAPIERPAPPADGLAAAVPRPASSQPRCCL